MLRKNKTLNLLNRREKITPRCKMEIAIVLHVTKLNENGESHEESQMGVPLPFS
jgi:hypothetical protein